jgi:hypothetical protein
MLYLLDTLIVSPIPCHLFNENLDITRCDDLDFSQFGIVNVLGAEFIRALLWQQRRPARFLDLWTPLPEVSLAFEVPHISRSHPVSEPLHVLCQLRVHRLAKLRDLVLVNIQELCLELLMVIVNPVYGALDVRFVVVHEGGNYVVVVITARLLLVV